MLIHNIPYLYIYIYIIINKSGGISSDAPSAHLCGGRNGLQPFRGILPRAGTARLRPRAEMLVSYGKIFYNLNILVTFTDFIPFWHIIKVKNVILS